jgi:hypothetical protein
MYWLTVSSTIEGKMSRIHFTGPHLCKAAKENATVKSATQLVFVAALIDKNAKIIAGNNLSHGCVVA